MGSIIMITMSSIVLAILPSLISSFSPEDLPLKESKYAFLMSPSASYAYPESASRYIPAYPSSYYEAESASEAQDSLSSAQLLPLPSIVSASSIPFVFGRKGKDKKASIVRGKPTLHKQSAAATSSQSAQSTDSQVDWSSDDMQQHPIDEAPRKVCILRLSHTRLSRPHSPPLPRTCISSACYSLF
jgi:hypothetical protein